MSSTEGQDALRQLCADLKRLVAECAGLTYESLARVCTRSRSQIGDILNGNIRRLPDRDVILRIVGKCASYAADHQITLSLSTERSYWHGAHAAVERSLASSRNTPPKSFTNDPWIDLVTKYTNDDVVGSQALAVTQYLAGERRAAMRKLKGDPWLDPDLARRVIDHTDALAAEAAGGELRFLSGIETALLVITPLLHQVRWLKAAAVIDIDPLDLRQTGTSNPDRADFERFLRGRQQQRLVVRATQRGLSDRTADSAEIGWWLFHRWIDTRPQDPMASVRLDDVVDDRRLRGMLLEPLDRVPLEKAVAPGQDTK